MALVALLATSRGGQRTRLWLQDRLWGEREREQAAASLRRELSNLRSSLTRPGWPVLVEADVHHVRINLDAVHVDFRELDADLANCVPHNVRGYGELLEGLDLSREEGFEDWLRDQRVLVEDLLEQARHQSWRAEANAGNDAPPSIEIALGAEPTLPIKPSISVLPFADLGGPTHLAEAIPEQISLTLGGWSTLFVVASGPAPVHPFNRSRLCRELGVRYLLEGSVQQAGDRVRVSVRLIDGVVGEQLWAEQFQEGLDRLFALQDEIAATVAPLIDSSMEKNERRLAGQSPPADADAHALYWRANGLVRRWNPDTTREAMRLLERALVIEPGSSWASSLLALCHSISIVQGWCGHPEHARNAVACNIEQAMETGADDPYVLGHVAGAKLGAGDDLASADALVCRALALNPGMPATLFWGGWTELALGRPASSLDRFLMALRLNPRMAVRAYVLAGMGLALLTLGRVQEAAPILAEAAAAAPRFAPAVLGAALCDVLGGGVQRTAWLAKIEAAGGLEQASRVIRDPAQQAMIATVLGLGPRAVAAA